MKIFLVYRTGGEYDQSHVLRLVKQIKRFNNAEISILTDDPRSIRHMSDWTYSMRENYPGWWSKMELFKFRGPLLYMDLDTTVLGPLDDLWDAAQKHKMVMLRDFYYPTQLGSGLMAWSGDMGILHEKFRDVSGGAIKAFRRGGDQHYVEKTLEEMGVPVSRWQELVPDQIFSYKADIRGRTVPPAAKVVCFHGKPRPWEVDELV